MRVSKEQLSSLKQKILKAFAAVPYPAEIVEHECDECRSLRKDFADKNWRTIEPKIIENNYDKIPLFSPTAFNYFLPAYLIYSLDNFSVENKTNTEFTIYALAPLKKNIRENFEYWKERFEGFNFEQLDCIYDFLSLVAEDDGHRDFVGDANGGRKNLKRFIEPIIRK